MQFGRLSGTVLIKDLSELDLEALTISITKRFTKSRKDRLNQVKEQITFIKEKEVKGVFDCKDRENELQRLAALRASIRNYEDRDGFLEKATELVDRLSKEPEAREEITEQYLEILSSIIKYELRLDEEPEDPESKEVAVVTSSKSRTRDDNSDRESFIKAFQRYRGQLLQNIPEALLEIIDNYLDSWEHLQKFHRRNAHKLALKENGTRKGTSLRMMMQVLKETQNPLFYDRAKPIAIVYWKWEIKDIGEFEDIILKDYNATQRVYKEKIKGKFRKSNLNIQYRLLKHLEARGIPVHRDDFKLICGREILIEYDKMWKIMVEESGISGLIFIPTA